IPPTQDLGGAYLSSEASEAYAPPEQHRRLGEVLLSLGPGAVGKMVERYWPDEGGWWMAQISAFDPDKGEHQLTYNAGRSDESFEWADLAEFHDSELREVGEDGRRR
ncbi:hypothetical protein H632_c1003p0, partial [Helicosporidium sp. ATCC 50920]